MHILKFFCTFATEIRNKSINTQVLKYGNNIMTTTIIFNSIKKESEKAILVSIPVTWNSNMHVKDMWFPKSVVGEISERTMDVKTWFIEKQENANIFHGYKMYFEEVR